MELRAAVRGFEVVLAPQLAAQDSAATASYVKRLMAVVDVPRTTNAPSAAAPGNHVSAHTA